MDDEPGVGDDEFTFVCPVCGESIAVNGPMRDALVENGCVVCGGPVTADAFSSRPD